MINWKEAARHYRQIATEAIHRFLQEQAVRLKEEQVVLAAKNYVDIVNTPHTPFVPLVTGVNIHEQKAQQILINAVADLESFIQTYSQTTPKSTTSDRS
jgi:hypothetical protein